jgi:outer membrane lipoprotein-sorting protein
MMLNRRSLLASGIAAIFAASAVPALAAPLSLNEISAYLNSLQTMKASFTQINSDGTISTGTLYIHRPGRARFEYAPPEKSLVMAGGGQVAIFDGRSNVAPEQYPLSKTPLSIILERNVNLAQRNMVVGHSQDGPATVVTAQDPAHPEYGSIKMKFTANPVELRQWVITDDAGGQTTVILGDLRKGEALGASLFSITAESDKRGL